MQDVPDAVVERRREDVEVKALPEAGEVAPVRCGDGALARGGRAGRGGPATALPALMGHDLILDMPMSRREDLCNPPRC